MKFPFFATTVLLTIFCFMMFIKSIDLGKGWAVALSITGLLTFGILSLVSLLYQMRQHDRAKGHHH